MTKTMHVIYDGKVLKPCEPVDLKKNVEYIVIIKSEGKKKNDFCNVLKSIAGTVEGPEDWAEKHDHYIYGTSKRNETKWEKKVILFNYRSA